jgi:hypothetical protein
MMSPEASLLGLPTVAQVLSSCPSFYSSFTELTYTSPASGKQAIVLCGKSPRRSVCVGTKLQASITTPQTLFHILQRGTGNYRDQHSPHVNAKEELVVHFTFLSLSCVCVCVCVCVCFVFARRLKPQQPQLPRDGFCHVPTICKHLYRSRIDST